MYRNRNKCKKVNINHAIYDIIFQVILQVINTYAQKGNKNCIKINAYLEAVRAERIYSRGGSEFFLLIQGRIATIFPNLIIVFYKNPKIQGRIDPPILLGSALTDNPSSQSSKILWKIMSSVCRGKAKINFEYISVAPKIPDEE